MAAVELRAGDMFCVASPGPLGAIIRGAEWLWSHDGEAIYSHSGIILDASGATLEAKRRVMVSSLDSYLGRRIIIARAMAPEWTKASAIRILRKRHEGQVYPAWRLVLHTMPPLARMVSAGGRYVVCSELTAKYQYYLAVRHKHYCGTSPDMLADEWRGGWRGVEVLTERVW